MRLGVETYGRLSFIERITSLREKVTTAIQNRNATNPLPTKSPRNQELILRLNLDMARCAKTSPDI